MPGRSGRSPSKRSDDTYEHWKVGQEKLYLSKDTSRRLAYFVNFHMYVVEFGRRHGRKKQLGMISPKPRNSVPCERVCGLADGAARLLQSCPS